MRCIFLYCRLQWIIFTVYRTLRFSQVCFVYKGWGKSADDSLGYSNFLRDWILFSFSHWCTIQHAFPGHHTQLLAGIMAAPPCQDYRLHHQVWETRISSQRSGPSTPAWGHRGYYYWYCAAMLPFSSSFLGHTECLADSNCVFDSIPWEQEALFLITSKRVLYGGAVELKTSQKAWIHENAVISILL